MKLTRVITYEDFFRLVCYNIFLFYLFKNVDMLHQILLIIPKIMISVIKRTDRAVESEFRLELAVLKSTDGTAQLNLGMSLINKMRRLNVART